MQYDFKKYSNITGLKSPGKGPRHSHPEFDGRKFLCCYNSLFPNNYLYHLELSALDLEIGAKEFKKTIYKAQNENEIQSYIKSKKKWFIPAAIYKEYNFGHHGDLTSAPSRSKIEPSFISLYVG